MKFRNHAEYSASLIEWFVLAELSALFRARSKSRMMSSTASNPTDRRIRLTVIPTASRSSSLTTALVHSDLPGQGRYSYSSIHTSIKRTLTGFEQQSRSHRNFRHSERFLNFGKTFIHRLKLKFMKFIKWKWLEIPHNLRFVGTFDVEPQNSTASGRLSLIQFVLRMGR